ncbi:PhnA protein [Endozoicomonas numazuensis]|uniref:PhnA protein n=1 Tax=Endozoicomonas numazuensis TaxID=1137799 RepID=A0A081ND46_9GAMM|nr:PhnA protein [Endozoicomonas numazuensis]KEQ16369.1 phnA protein [Endozoicomonas numazuensis]
MAKGLLKHQERQAALNLLGKNLARRASSKCELCEASGVPLKTYEVAPVPDEPDFEHCLMTCETCKDQLSLFENKPTKMNADHWRCLGKTVWSQVPAAQVMSVRILRQMSEPHPWAAETLEHVFLDPEIESWVQETD